MTTTPWYRRIAARWPTALALGMSTLMAGGAGTDDGTWMFAGILPLLPLLYLVVATLERRRATWPLLAAGFAVIFLLRALDLISSGVVFWAVALVVLVWNAIGGRLWRDGTLQLQAVGMLVFGGIGLAGLVVDPELGRYLVAAGWLFHGVWDVVHLKLNRVVARSFAEWCAVVDVAVAAGLVFQL
ncbi:hypothetical protein [Jiangella muralis]|uniref:hypothetical protein n=1 Tax=Jiangella muralis TaxID=702383 RepID=UPI00069E6698|nr:hypothetical protein [Jiangella muralis]